MALTELAGAALIFLWGLIAVLLVLGRLGGSAAESGDAVFLFLIVGMHVVPAGLLAALGVGSLQGRRWAWPASIVCAVLLVSVAALAFLGVSLWHVESTTSTSEGTGGSSEIVSAGATLGWAHGVALLGLAGAQGWYLTRRRTRAFFLRGGVTSPRIYPFGA